MLTKKRFLTGTLLMIILVVSGSLFSCTGATPTTATVSTPPVSTTVPVITPTSPSGDLSFLIHEDPANVDNSLLPVTPVDKIHVTGTPSSVNATEYRLAVDGLVDTPLSLSYDDILQMPSVSEVVLLICPGIFADNAEWTGVPVSTLLEKAGVSDNATEILFYDGDQYHKAFFLKDMLRDGVFLAYNVDGQPLPQKHGFPLRLVVKGEYGNTWVKWVDRIEII
jgi:DMSO/TMAO reductase YedYZ molybdopterin-dependent catalytic subunit